MTTLIKLMTLFLLALTFSQNLQCQQVTYRPMEFEETPNYGLLVPLPIDYEQLFSDEYLVRIDSSGVDDGYQILDTIQSQFISPADSNVFIYTDIGESNTYLIALTLSPRLNRDTLLYYANDDPKNWLKGVVGMSCSIKDSVLVLPSWNTRESINIKLIKVLPDNQWKVEKEFNSVRSTSISHDFTQLLICPHSGFTNLAPAGSIMIIDLLLDTTYVLKELGNSNIQAKRRSRESPIYVLQKISNKTDIWVYFYRDKPVKITHFDSEIEIIGFKLFYRYLLISVVDYSKSKEGEFGFEIIYDAFIRRR